MTVSELRAVLAKLESEGMGHVPVKFGPEGAPLCVYVAWEEVVMVENEEDVTISDDRADGWAWREGVLVEV